ncbi:GNAT family N-acetyltransferase [Bacillus carboniphilus]|uniref:GNAT family N-acetyltransferase n=1 Tax=Bacillus carboniphilus TaxID=86663 RepID=A0ABY9JSB4_9BACI|nr:GNAT family N-acetyltransferase [Bacillus carboniphilus]WLR42281.1 GNAT family N-acetyltransferase [Bacillus carboniphilus]
MKVTIRTAEKKECEDVLEVLNKATLDLLKKGINQWSYPWDQESIKQQLDDAFVMILGNTIVGTFFISLRNTISDLELEKGSYYLHKIAVHPFHQGKDLGSEILRFVYAYVKKQQKSVYLACWAGNEKLKQFYLNNGLMYVGDFPEEDYFISVFKFV